MPGSCVVVVVHTEEDLTVDHYLFYGGAVNEPMPSVEDSKPSTLPGKRDIEGNRKTRQHYRDVKRNRFQGPLTAAGLLEALFGDLGRQHSEQQAC
jgi:hypothetical protein